MTLEPSEQILWTGAPQRIPLFAPLDRMAIPIQALVIAAAVVVAVLNAGHPATAIAA